jgi:hypothetical protein
VTTQLDSFVANVSLAVTTQMDSFVANASLAVTTQMIGNDLEQLF